MLQFLPRALNHFGQNLVPWCSQSTCKLRSWWGGKIYECPGPSSFLGCLKNCFHFIICHIPALHCLNTQREGSKCAKCNFVKMELFEIKMKRSSFETLKESRWRGGRRGKGEIRKMRWWWLWWEDNHDVMMLTMGHWDKMMMSIMKEGKRKTESDGARGVGRQDTAPSYRVSSLGHNAF